MAGPYDFEEQERLAELKGWWEDNRWYVIGAIVAAVVAYAGYEGWKTWNQRKADEAAGLYRPIAAAAKDNDPKKVAEAAKPLIDKHPRSFYASEAALLLAKNAFEAGNLAEAQKQLEWVLASGVDELRGVARLRLAAVLLEQKKYDAALKVLDDNKDAAFTALAADMRGDVMLAQGRIDEARAAYKLAIDKAEPRNPVKQIAQTKLDALGGAQ
jgi:predicted negative regulator of RcsB-dependent stress response